MYKTIQDTYEKYEKSIPIFRESINPQNSIHFNIKNSIVKKYEKSILFLRQCKNFQVIKSHKKFFFTLTENNPKIYCLSYDDPKPEIDNLPKKNFMEVLRLRNLCIEIFKILRNISPSFMKDIFCFEETDRPMQ